MSKTRPKVKLSDSDVNAPIAKSKSKMERVEPGLYRYTPTGAFYSVLKRDGKTTFKKLGTTDKPTARRQLAQERQNQVSLDAKLSGLEFGDLCNTYLGTVAGKAPRTIYTRKGIVKRLQARFSPKVLVRDIKESEVTTWGASLKMKERSANEYFRVTKEIFKLAVADRAIIKSPADGLKRKKLKDIDRRTPTHDQFWALVADIRGQRFSPHAADSADFVEFMGLAGLGEAELRNLRICDIHKKKEQIEVGEGDAKHFEERIVRHMAVRRQKTGKSFRVPVYPQVETLLLKLLAQASLPEPKTNEEKASFPLRRLFRINGSKKAILGACRRLGLPPFEPRSFRRLFITRAVERGLSFQIIAATQGHKDGGVLVAKTYAHLRPEHFDEMAAKLT